MVQTPANHKVLAQLRAQEIRPLLSHGICEAFWRGGLAAQLWDGLVSTEILAPCFSLWLSGARLHGVRPSWVCGGEGGGHACAALDGEDPDTTRGSVCLTVSVELDTDTNSVPFVVTRYVWTTISVLRQTSLGILLETNSGPVDLAKVYALFILGFIW